jgi:UDP-N-acetylmuramate--alanine ligase
MKRIHFVGIKGVAMAALAVWYKEAGYMVTGSDVTEEFPTDKVLSKAKISVLGFDSKNIINIHPDIVIYTGAHGGRENDEVVEAMALGIPTLPHGKALGLIMEGNKQVSVAGSHGKTTTSAMIATILTDAGMDPSYAIGCGEIRGLGLPGHCGKKGIFVAEADEYVTDPNHDSTPRFLWQNPDILVVTNIDFDHPDAYTSLADVQKVFVKLQKQSKLTIVNADDSASKVLMKTDGISYGFSPKAEFRVTNVRFGAERTFFTLSERGMEIGEFTLKVPGRHNAMNAAAAALACKQLGVSWEDSKKGLQVFGGTKRRFEFVGSPPAGGGDIRVYDDYAHHPTEIKAQLAAVRQWFPHNRIIVVFQPHTCSRTKALMSEFSHAFTDAHKVILTDIYSSARETDTFGVTGKTLVEETAKHHTDVLYAPDFPHVAALLRQHMQPNDIILFMGAGSIYTWAHEFTNPTNTTNKYKL